MQKYGDQEKIAGSEHQVTGCAVVRTDGQLDHSEHRKRVESSVLTAPAVSWKDNWCSSSDWGPVKHD